VLAVVKTDKVVAEIPSPSPWCSTIGSATGPTRFDASTASSSW